MAAVVRATFLHAHPGADTTLIDTLFRDVEDMFHGRYLDYLPLDMRYHDFEHTLQAVLCFVQLLEGRYRAKVTPALSQRQFELAIAAVLLHDTGYLKLRSDSEGTGAKYTYVHVIRSCSFAASYLPTLGFNDEEVESVVAAIRCTGPRSNITQLHFSGEVEHFIGCALATADYLGQMAAPDYVDELAFLYAEFEESDNFFNIPREKRLFRSVRDLIAKTPVFWEKFVLPRITHDYLGIYRYLADPYPGGPNAYLQAIEQNMTRAITLAYAPEVSLDPFPQPPQGRSSRSPSLPGA
ncbi:MAG: hypothetical protein PHE83_11760 [Opitutaceae bacterium]|nr:hypothetical protein [Opitutaceae bacterium]